MDQLASMRANMRAFYRLLGDRSPGGSVFVRGSELASIVPSCPRRSIVNAVVYEDPAGLAEAYAAIAACYDGAGVLAWTVWVPESDTGTAKFLEAAGHKLDARPRAMVAELAALDLSTPAELKWERTSDVAMLAAINEAAYGLPPGEFACAVTAFSDAGIALYLARLGGDPAACLGTVTAGGDCGIYFVATNPAARGRGLASGLLRQALRDARDRGCTTSSLQATKAGFPIYERLGYRDLCAIDMWERRRGDAS